MTTIFSPRSNIDPLSWYVRLADSAKQGVFLTAPFGLQEEIAPVFAGDRDYLRYLLLLLLDTEEGEIKALRRDPDNIVSAGRYKGSGSYRAWVAKALRRLNGFRRLRAHEADDRRPPDREPSRGHGALPTGATSLAKQTMRTWS